MEGRRLATRVLDDEVQGCEHVRGQERTFFLRSLPRSEEGLGLGCQRRESLVGENSSQASEDGASFGVAWDHRHSYP